MNESCPTDEWVHHTYIESQYNNVRTSSPRIHQSNEYVMSRRINEQPKLISTNLFPNLSPTIILIVIIIIILIIIIIIIILIIMIISNPKPHTPHPTPHLPHPKPTTFCDPCFDSECQLTILSQMGRVYLALLIFVTNCVSLWVSLSTYVRLFLYM